MIALNLPLQLLLMSELILFLASIILLYFEINSLRPVITQATTLNLLFFLTSLSLMILSRVIGIYYSNIAIRKYGGSLFGLLASIFLVNWGSMMLEASPRRQKIMMSAILLGFASYVVGQVNSLEIAIAIGIALLVGSFITQFLLMFKYVFKKSPYLRARQRVFLLSVSFIIWFVIEGIGLELMNMGLFALSSLFFLFEVPCRIGLSLSIKLPPRVTSILSGFIN